MTPDLITLAREVLDAEKVQDNTPGTLYLDGPTHEHEEAASTILDAAPALAHAVTRVAELADNLDSEADCLREMGVHATDHGLYAHRIRAALNGAPA